MKQLAAYWLAAMLLVGVLFGAGQLYKHSQTEQTETSAVKRYPAPPRPVVIETPATEGRPRMITTYTDRWTQVMVFGPFVTAAVYTVCTGDELGKIAKAHGLKGWGSTYRLNRKVIGANPNLIKPGQKLLIPKEFYWESGINPSRASTFGKGKQQFTDSFKSCGICHVQFARTEDRVDCQPCHKSQQVITSATAHAKRSIVTRRAARSSSVFYWRNPGANPFYTEKQPRDFVKVVRKMRLTQEDQERVIAQLRAKLLNSLQSQ
jgi:hypothetical protein